MILPPSFNALPIKCLSNGSVLAPATAFFYLQNEQHYLISNWHVFSGRHPNTGKPLHSSLAVPSEIRISIHGNIHGQYEADISIPLICEDGESRVFQHARGRDIDVAAIQVDLDEAELKAHCVNAIPRGDMLFGIASDVFILGFPRGMAHQGILPVWKRGTIAAEPEFMRDDQLPIYLVDSATREGMSGAPVYLFEYGTYQKPDYSVGIAPGYAAKFLGICSGRYGADDESGMQIGRIWKEDAIVETINLKSTLSNQQYPTQ